jgi:type VII secretion protein EccB
MTWSRRDQIQAYQFLRRRSTSALVLADANHPESPTRRPLIATLAGAVVLVLVLAGFGIYGLLRPGAAKEWRRPGTIVMEKETGARYVLADDGRLHPVLNYASARLVVGGDTPRTATVSAASLRGTPRGPVIGIPGAPDALPRSSALLTGGWSVCSRPGGGGGDPVTVVMLGNPPAGPALGAGGLLVADRRGTPYLLADGRRWAVRDAAVLPALNYTGAARLPVADAWLDAVPAGTDLRFPAVEGRGTAPGWAAPPGVRIGQVVEVSNVGTVTRYFLVEKAGLRALGETEAALALGDPRATAAYPGIPVRPVPVAPAALTEAPAVPDPVARPDYPARPPALVATTGAVSVCAVPGAGPTAVPALHLVPAATLAARKPLTVAGGAREVVVPPGRGALARAEGDGGALYLVTDQGLRYPLRDDAARAALGYGRARPVVLSTRILELLPLGPVLDRAAARAAAS